MTREEFNKIKQAYFEKVKDFHPMQDVSQLKEYQLYVGASNIIAWFGCSDEKEKNEENRRAYSRGMANFSQEPLNLEKEETAEMPIKKSWHLKLLERLWGLK